MEKVEDVLLHQKLLASAEDPDNQPVFHIRFLEVHLAFFITHFHSRVFVSVCASSGV